MQLPLQRYAITASDGAPAFVDPTLFALALRLPLKDCIQRGIRWGGCGLWAGWDRSLGWQATPTACCCARCPWVITPLLQLNACCPPAQPA